TQRSAETSSLAALSDDPLLFPAVAQSIIEVQTISLREWFLYTYPYISVACAAMVSAALLFVICPAFAWLAPLAALWLLSMTMGARMTMFGPAVLYPALCISGGCLLEWAAGNAWSALGRRRRLLAMEAADAPFEIRGATGAPEVTDEQRPPLFLKALFSLLVTVSLAWPLARYIPDYTQGPILSREQAVALTWLKKNSDAQAIIWNWWDWGYATHHFAHRHTIADGARHGGPSLYLPAAVYTTSDPRFARQIIKHTALSGNVPGQVFAGMTAASAHKLMQDLGDVRQDLVQAPGRQYLVVSFELLRLGLWVTRYGSWDFSTRQGRGAIMNNLTPALRYNTDTGVIMAEGAEPVYAADIVAFDGKKLEHYNYGRSGAFHFFFNLQDQTPGKEPAGPAADFWSFVRGPGSLSFAVTDKMAMDPVFFNSMMVQLLIRNPQDPFIAPYFKLVFDNVYTRVYEVL
ncbi:hypothetical protein LJC15_06045, partial [Desulfovibrio sp. OttesenSCG-928-G11]|nr:hypothetical protein [Desulfovibrio sp. OttesenSCG-928-G11]